MYYEYWVPVLICCVAAFIAALACLIPIGLKSRKTAVEMNYVAGKLDKQKRCTIENVSSIQSKIMKSASLTIKTIWDRYRADSDNMFDGEHVPEPEVYFTYKELFSIPNRESYFSILWGLLPFFAFLSLVSPAAALLFPEAEITAERLRSCLSAGCSGLLLIAAVFAVAFSFARSIKMKNEATLFHFNRALAALLPIINQSTQASLLLKASRQNTEAFIATAKVIADKLEHFAVKGITPVVADAFKKSVAEHIEPGINKMEIAMAEFSKTVAQQQDTGMKALANAFADNLSGSLGNHVRELGTNMETLGVQLTAMQNGLESTAATLYSSLSEDRTVLKETAEVSRAIASHHAAVDRNVAEMAAALTRAEQLVDKLKERDDGVFTRLTANSDQIMTVQEQLRGQLLAMEEATKSAAETMTGTSDAVSASVQALIVSTNETSEKTYALIADKIAGFLLETNEVNADTYGKVSETVQTLIEQSTQAAETGYERISLKLSDILGETAATNTETYAKISEAVASLIDKTGQTADAGYERISGRLSEILNETAAANTETYGRISLAVENVAKTAGETVNTVFERYSEQLISVLNETIRTNNDTSLKLAATMESLSLAGSEQYEKAARAAAQLLEDIVVEMNKAMDGVGHEIAESISQASLGSAEIVDRLGEKTLELKNEYDVYFARVEKQSLTNVNELEFRMQNVFSRFNNEATVVMDRLENSIGSAMNLFEGNTAELLQSLEEQSRSIGLYAKDLNIDVASLTTSLRESVGIFTEHLTSSTRKTFEEFDEGLSEVGARLANTVESIREAVENLPKVIGKRE